MGMLKWFNKQKYSGLGEVLSSIRQELKSLQPSDSSDIVWSKNANGMIAKFRGNNATATQNELEESTSQPSGYNGYFTLKDVSTYNEDGTVKEYRVAVCDGETWNPQTETSLSMPVYVNDYVVAHFECCVFSLPENTDISIAICVIDKDYDISRDFHTSKIYDISKYGYGNYAICIVAIPGVHVPNVYAKYLIGERDLYYSDKLIRVVCRSPFQQYASV